ncbi:MAG: flavodoxin family protein [Rikenellaceae bacterium]
MKVVAILGSPRKNGNTAHALRIIGDELIKEGIEFEIIHIGNKNIRGCLACKQCAVNKNGECIIKDETNTTIAKMAESDGIILSSPVYFSGIAGTMKSFLDRAFYVSSSNGSMFRGKVAAAITAVRRSGGSHTLDGLNHYITYGEMIVATSTYWNIAHGRDEGEVLKDDEAVQTMQMLGRNMAWLLKMKEQANIPQPEKVDKIFTKFL